MEKIDKILSGAMAKKGLTQATQGALVCFYAGEWAKGLFRPISFKSGVLKIAVDSSPAASEIHIKEAELVDYLNQKLGKRSVRFVRIIVQNNTKHDYSN